MIIAGIKLYRAEYGELPPASPDGRVITPEQNARLFRILLGLESNPKQICFFDGNQASLRNISGQTKWCGGFDPATGACIDPWGNFYRVIYDTTGKGQIQSPYEDQRDTPIRAMLIAWSFGRDGVQSPAHKIKGRIADDIISWQ